MKTPQIVSGISNREFLEMHAAPGRVGLAGGADLISRLITRAQRHVGEEKNRSLWSHAFLFQGQRLDGHHWVLESDLEVHRKNIRLGVQENRAAKFWDDEQYPSLAVLDFGMGEEQVANVFREALEMVSGRVRYSLRELMGTLIALRRPTMRTRPNPMSRNRSVYCSAFVTHVMRKSGVDPVPGLDVKHATPEDLFRSSSVAQVWLLKREKKETPSLTQRVRARLRGK